MVGAGSNRSNFRPKLVDRVSQRVVLVGGDVGQVPLPRSSILGGCAALDGLLEPNNDAVTLGTLRQAAVAVWNSRERLLLG